MLRFGLVARCEVRTRRERQEKLAVKCMREGEKKMEG